MTLADYYLEKHGFRMFYHDDRITRNRNLMVVKNGKRVKGSVPLELLSTSEWNTATISFIVGMLAGYLQSQIDMEDDNNEI